MSESIQILIPSDAIRKRVEELAAQISADYAGRELKLLGVLKGCFVFMADLARAITVPMTCDFMGLQSYGDATHTSGIVQITKDLTDSITGKHVLIVEDIVDTGLTIRYLLQNIQNRLPASVKICTLLYKPESDQAKIALDYVGFRIPQRFVIGYGLDYMGRYRNFPHIGAMYLDGTIV